MREATTSRPAKVLWCVLLAGLLCALGGMAMPTAHAQEESAPAAASDAPMDTAAADAATLDAHMATLAVVKTRPYQILLVFTFVLAIFLGVELIAKVPSQLHTPLMSGSNAISGITIVGALLAAGQTEGRIPIIILGFLAVVCASINVVGGYLVTNRMLAMFKHKEGK